MVNQRVCDDLLWVLSGSEWVGPNFLGFWDHWAVVWVQI